MKRMIAVCMSVLLLTGCSGRTAGQETGGTTAQKSIVYSNLANEATQKEVTALLKDHGVTKEQTDMLVSWVNDVNDRISAGTLAEDFESMGEKGADYDGLIVTYKDDADGMPLPEANCRLTSYLLLKNKIQTNGKKFDDDTYLMFDVEAIDTYEPFHLTEEERSNFISLFNWVPVKGTSTLDEHIAKVQEAWKDREIQVTGKGISLITVYLHSTFEEVRFVGHTGVLVEDKDGLLFVEKYGPMFPFQATNFNNREELKTYILNRQDLYGDETELEPIIMENGELM